MTALCSTATRLEKNALDEARFKMIMGERHIDLLAIINVK